MDFFIIIILISSSRFTYNVNKVLHNKTNIYAEKHLFSTLFLTLLIRF